MTTEAFPTIHLNGSSAEQLKAALEAANDALLAAEDALAKTAPNMRDFYVQPNGDAAFAAARQAHVVGLGALAAIRTRIEATWEAIEHQLDDRRAERASEDRAENARLTR